MGIVINMKRNKHRNQSIKELDLVDEKLDMINKLENSIREIDGIFSKLEKSLPFPIRQKANIKLKNCIKMVDMMHSEVETITDLNHAINKLLKNNGLYLTNVIVDTSTIKRRLKSLKFKMLSQLEPKEAMNIN